ncbi:mandelamide amidase [Klenkia marina]|uniref:Mandelamide amidase n=1 Tax=Klenkia marina TaxID=1960309 RepID=A0A1G4XEU1_9ACTN|nr:amidase family protein [Klenkia marina]SCX39752.1 mandelamide amidase [Klenkia marina]
MAQLDRLDIARSRGGTVAERLTDAAARAHATDHLGAFLAVVDPDRVDPGLAPEGPLAGVPIAVKDNVDVLDLPTSAGTPALHGSRPGRDHHAVARLRAAGASVVGKTNLHELAFGITSNNSAYGPVRNPHDPTRSAGGSSGGSAVAVATGVVPVALGTDTGGSMRVPAAHCGVVGYRPTTGRWGGHDGVVGISSTRDTVGALASTVADVVLLDQLVAGAGPATVPHARMLRLGVPLPGFFDGLAKDVADAVGRALDTLADAGVDLVEVDVVAAHELDARCGFPIVFHEVLRTLPAYLGSLPGGPSFDELVAGVASPDVRGALEHAIGDPVPGSVYAECLELREQLRAAYAAVHELPGGGRLDALVYPTTPLTAPPLGDDVTTDLDGEQVPVFGTTIQNTGPGSTAGMPAISLPCGTTPAGLPVGLSLETVPDADPHLLAVARRVEQLLS